MLPRVAALLVILLLPGAVVSPAAAGAPQRIAVLNWSIAQTLLALGVEPVAVADVRLYREWVSEPPIPPGTADLGRRLEPNLSILAGLKPELILMTGHYPQIRSRVEPIAPIETHTLYTPEGDPLERAFDMAGRLAERLDRGAELLQIQARWDRALAALREHNRPMSVYVVQFRDAGHVRVFGKGSLYQGVLERAGLRNAWRGDTNFWGFALAEITQLDDAADLLVVIEPVPVRAEDMMGRSPVWQALPAVRDGRVVYMEPVWSFGSLPSAIRFAEQLGDVLDAS